MSIASFLCQWIKPAPDSMAAQERRLGRPVWPMFVHLVWSVWVFITPAFSDGDFGYTTRWFALTLASYPLFLWLYAASVFACDDCLRVCGGGTDRIGSYASARMNATHPMIRSHRPERREQA